MSSISLCCRRAIHDSSMNYACQELCITLKTPGSIQISNICICNNWQLQFYNHQCHSQLHSLNHCHIFVIQFTSMKFSFWCHYEEKVTYIFCFFQLYLKDVIKSAIESNIIQLNVQVTRNTNNEYWKIDDIHNASNVRLLE